MNTTDPCGAWVTEVRRRLYLELPVEVFRGMIVHAGSSQDDLTLCVTFRDTAGHETTHSFATGLNIKPETVVQEILAWAQVNKIC